MDYACTSKLSFWDCFPDTLLKTTVSNLTTLSFWTAQGCRFCRIPLSRISEHKYCFYRFQVFVRQGRLKYWWSIPNFLARSFELLVCRINAARTLGSRVGQISVSGTSDKHIKCIYHVYTSRIAYELLGVHHVATRAHKNTISESHTCIWTRNLQETNELCMHLL